MTERTPDHSPVAHPPVPDSSHLPQDKGGERASFDFKGISLQDAIDRGLVHGVTLDPETGEPIAIVPDSLGGVREPSKTEKTEDFVPLSPEHKGWSLKKKVIAALTAAAGVLVGTLGVSYATNANRPAPVATASTDPSPTPDVASPSSAEASPTPTAPELPFDEARVRIMRAETAAEFYDNNGLKPRIQYALSRLHNEIDGKNGETFGHKLQQVLPHNNKKLSDYNPFKMISLTADSDPQDVMDAYLANFLFAVAQEDVEEGKKMLGIVVSDPKSEVFKDLEVQVVKHTGKTATDESSVLSEHYKSAKATRDVDEETGKPRLTIITDGGFQNVFIFEQVENLATANQNTEDNGQEVGAWLLKSSKMGKVTIRF